MTRDALVQQALGYQFEGYERSIDAHVKNIRQKIEDDPKNPSLILTVYGVGYKFIGNAMIKSLWIKFLVLLFAVSVIALSAGVRPPRTHDPRFSAVP